MGDAPGAINQKESYHYYYVYDHGNVFSWTDVWNYGAYDVQSFGAQMMFGVQGGDLGWWKAHNFRGQHAMTAYGTDNSGTRTLYVWDPLAQSWAGYHTLGASDGYTAVADGGKEFVV